MNALVLTGLLVLMTSPSSGAFADVTAACNPKESNLECLRGCLTCYDAFSKSEYSLIECCRGEF